MQFVSEKTIDETIDFFQSDEALYDQTILEFNKEQPGIRNYLLSEEFDSLSSDEKEVLLYMNIIVYNAIKKNHPTIPAVTVDELENCEEQNWELLDNITEKRFSDRLTVFFEKSTQEDLLAFFEDALVEEEEEYKFITKEGREPMFIALKSVVDAIELQFA